MAKNPNRNLTFLVGRLESEIYRKFGYDFSIEVQRHAVGFFDDDLITIAVAHQGQKKHACVCSFYGGDCSKALKEGRDLVAEKIEAMANKIREQQDLENKVVGGDK